MAGPNYVLDKGYKAGGAIGKYRYVEFSAVETVSLAAYVAGANDDLAGICQEEVSAGDATNGRIVGVRHLGISRAIAGGTITKATEARLMPHATTGALITWATAGSKVVGIALQDAVAGDHFDVLLCVPVRQAT
jgi:hypothetical protein